MPSGRKRAAFRLAIADDARDDQPRIIKRGTKRVAEGIAQLATLVDGARCFGRGMAGNTSRKRELPEQRAQACLHSL